MFAKALQDLTNNVVEYIEYEKNIGHESFMSIKAYQHLKNCLDELKEVMDIKTAAQDDFADAVGSIKTDIQEQSV